MFNGQNGVEDTGAIILDFYVPISMATVEMGDAGQDQDDLLLKIFQTVRS
jgi:hypothetical protein